MFMRVEIIIHMYVYVYEFRKQGRYTNSLYLRNTIYDKYK